MTPRIAATVLLPQLLCVSLAEAKEPEPTVSLAVMPLQAKRVAKEAVEVLDDLLINAVDRVGRFKVISASDINAMLGLEKAKQALGCTDVTCAAEIGGALGVDFMLAGSIGKLGDELIVTLQLIDIQKPEVKSRAQVTVVDDENNYRQAVQSAVRKLLGLPEATAAAGPATGQPASRSSVTHAPPAAPTSPGAPSGPAQVPSATFVGIAADASSSAGAANRSSWATLMSTDPEFARLSARLREPDLRRYLDYHETESNPLSIRPWIEVQNQESTPLLLAELATLTMAGSGLALGAANGFDNTGPSMVGALMFGLGFVSFVILGAVDSADVGSVSLSASQ